MAVVQTPEERFTDLPGYPFEPRYVTIADPEHGPLRMHYVDMGPSDGEPVLLVHGQPTWSYLYRKMIVRLAERGLRAIAPDYIGYGRSDKITDRLAYTLEGHVEWLMCYRADGSARFVGHQLMNGSIGDRSGTFVIEADGEFSGTTSKGDWRVVPGTGTGGMEGIQGDGGFVAEHGPNASYHLNLTFV